MKRLNAIVAIDAARGIGKNNSIPWSKESFAADDVKFFRAKTLNCTVIMGARTWESIGKPLPQRTNVVVSKTISHASLPKGVIAASSLEDAILKSPTQEIWVIGGVELYKEFLNHPLAAALYQTLIPCVWQCDRFFPEHHWPFSTSEQIGALEVAKFTRPPSTIGAELRYNDILCRLLLAPLRDNRTGIQTRSLIGETIRFPLTRESRTVIPLLTCKQVLARSVFIELLWFLSGETDIKFLTKNNVHIWDANTTKSFIESRGLALAPGETGPIYGYQWRHWGGDQLAKVIAELIRDKTSRRLVVSAWNVEDLDKMVLPPCHYAFQFVCTDRLNIVVNMRSADMGLGVPFNIASYSFLAHMVALVAGIPPGEVIINMADCHLYTNHEAAVEQWIKREPAGSPFIEFSPRIRDAAAAGTLALSDFTWDDIEISDYYHGGALTMQMAV